MIEEIGGLYWYALFFSKLNNEYIHTILLTQDNEYEFDINEDTYKTFTKDELINLKEYLQNKGLKEFSGTKMDKGIFLDRSYSLMEDSTKYKCIQVIHNNLKNNLYAVYLHFLFQELLLFVVFQLLSFPFCFHRIEKERLMQKTVWEFFSFLLFLIEIIKSSSFLIAFFSSSLKNEKKVLFGYFLSW